MTWMKKLLTIGVLMAVAITMLAATQAEARPQYQKAFVKKYPKLTALAKKAKCNVCHRKKKAGEKGKPRNDYGTAMVKAGMKKNCKVAAKIVEALVKTEKIVVVKGKKETFGDRLKAGKLPGSPAKK
ncbi:MAG: hypothetical protein CMJ65_02520 [Planctomycetaceae bacterium]|nr:hypothetical protein [Planctomycetaceae bacterium]